MPYKWNPKTQTSELKRKKKPGRKKMKKKPESEKHIPGRRRGTGKAAEKKREAIAALVAAGVPDKQALQMAGYSPNTRGITTRSDVKETAAQMRERLQMTQGNTLEDSVGFYRDIANDKGNDVGDRIRARSQVDKLLGHEASKKVEVSSTHEMHKAVLILSNLSVSPSELLKMANAGGA